MSLTNNSTKKLDIGGHFLRNTVVAGVCFVIDFAVFLLLKNSLNSSLALIIGYTAGLGLNYVLSRFWVFQERRYKKTSVEFIYFSTFALSGLVVDLSIFTIAQTVLPDWFARLVSIGVAFLWNFALKEYILFRPKRRISFSEVSKKYKNLSKAHYMYLLVRFITTPVELIAKCIPASTKTVLEIGAGSGINLVVAGMFQSQAKLFAYEPDDEKIKFINASTQNIQIIPKLDTQQQYDAILIVDVLYLLSKDDREALLNTAVSMLTKNGVLIIKDMSVKPAYKAYWNRIQECISVHVTKMTLSNGAFNVWTVEEIADYARSQGYSANLHRIDRHYIHPHAIVKITKK
ncbi:methyltransferase domain-containing protein [bacterium]|nr:methyltransferase domain-containing protein [bacterium]NBX97719.1 methyltransferase domain-containing protein [bacterium]NDC94208.1 methyltransferase domain-containing protein [bacterium]NDD84397.1 methyltransferase domain-containing protein [bacterium]NDG29713.1 methyltransferase domain-containing protein [bacterium]